MAAQSQKRQRRPRTETDAQEKKPRISEFAHILFHFLASLIGTNSVRPFNLFLDGFIPPKRQKQLKTLASVSDAIVDETDGLRMATTSPRSTNAPKLDLLATTAATTTSIPWADLRWP